MTKEQLRMKTGELETEIEELMQYMHMKIKAKDFHAVSDAANDARELEAQIETLVDLFEQELE